MGQIHGQQHHAVPGGAHLLQRSALNQRHIAVQNQRLAVVGQQRHGLLHGVASAQLRRLQGKLHATFGQGAWHHFAAMSIHHTNLLRRHALRAIHHMPHHGLARQRVQHLGQGGIHPRPFARCQNHHIQCAHVCSYPKQ